MEEEVIEVEHTEEFIEQAKQALMELGLEEDEAEREVEDYLNIY